MQQFATAPIHSSDEIHAHDLIRSVVIPGGDNDRESDTALECAMFFLSRDNSEDEQGKKHGRESLTKLAGEGKLPNIVELYDANTAQEEEGSASIVPEIFHFVWGIDTSSTIAKAAAKAKSAGGSSKSAPVPEISLYEYERKVSGEYAQANDKRSKEIEAANVVVVKVEPSEYERFDRNVADAVAGKNAGATVGTVVIVAQRSTDEVKEERNQYYRALQQRQQEHPVSRKLAANSRRLEDQNNEEENGEDQQNNNNYRNNADMAGTYYVSLTPNIFAGILFTIMFATVTWIAVSCMGMIRGQDVYVKKVPYIGREA